MIEPKTKLGKFVRLKRAKLKLSQIGLAKLTGKTKDTISKIEIGRSLFLSQATLRGLAAIFDCGVEQLKVLVPFRGRRNKCKTALGKIIYSRRKKLKLRLSELAGSGITYKTLDNIEGGRAPALLPQTAQRLTEALGLNHSQLSKFIFTREKESRSTLGQLLRSRRKELGLSQEQLSKKIGTSRAHISLIELGEMSLCQSKITKKLARALKLDVAAIEKLRSKRKVNKTKPRKTRLGKLITSTRKRLGWSAKELAARAGVSRPWLFKIEMGVCEPSSAIAEKLAKALRFRDPRQILNQRPASQKPSGLL